MDKFLICGLGNPGDEYQGTRHNTGFMVLDAFAKVSNIHFEDKRYGYIAETTVKGCKIFLLKPATFMNLSGNGGTITPGASGGDAKKNFFGDEDFCY